MFSQLEMWLEVSWRRVSNHLDATFLKPSYITNLPPTWTFCQLKLGRDESLSRVGLKFRAVETRGRDVKGPIRLIHVSMRVAAR